MDIPERYPPFPFLRTFKPMLKRAWGTASYQDMRLLLQLWLHCKRTRQLLEGQSERLCHAAGARDVMLATSHRIT